MVRWQPPADFAAVIFDNDGTLVDSSASVTRSWERFAADHGIELQSMAGLHGVPARGIVERLVPDGDIDELTAQITRYEVADHGGTVALPGAIAAVRALAGTGRVAVATSANTDLATARLAAAGIPDPDVLVTVDDVTRGKPHAEPFLLAAARLGVDPGECLVVEDAPSGLAAARAAGCASLAVTTHHTSAELYAAHAGLVVTDLAQVDFVTTREGRVQVDALG